MTRKRPKAKDAEGLFFVSLLFQKEHPDFPKAPVPTYMQFVHENFAKVKERHSSLTPVEVGIRIKKKWDKLTDEEKVNDVGAD